MVQSDRGHPTAEPAQAGAADLCGVAAQVRQGDIVSAWWQHRPDLWLLHPHPHDVIISPHPTVHRTSSASSATNYMTIIQRHCTHDTCTCNLFANLHNCATVSQSQKFMAHIVALKPGTSTHCITINGAVYISVFIIYIQWSPKVNALNRIWRGKYSVHI